jgi:DNA replicative helicase MCM subunit Mcm2 (Cdc46/Mcm family)
MAEPKRREIVFVCRECDRELEIDFHEGSQGEVVFMVELCPECLERERDEYYREGYSTGHTDGLANRRVNAGHYRQYLV